MKKIILLLLIPAFSFSQDIPKKSNTILIKGVQYSTIINALLDKGFTIEKSDSVYKTAQTNYMNWKMPNGKESIDDWCIIVRVKNDTAIIKGKWYSYIGLTRHLGESKKEPGPGDIYDAEYTWGANKKIFESLNDFAKKLNGEITYTKQP